MNFSLLKKVGFAEEIFGKSHTMEGRALDKEETSFDHGVQIELMRVKHVMAQKQIEIHLKLPRTSRHLRYNPHMNVVELQRLLASALA